MDLCICFHIFPYKKQQDAFFSIAKSTVAVPLLSVKIDTSIGIYKRTDQQ